MDSNGTSRPSILPHRLVWRAMGSVDRMELMALTKRSRKNDRYKDAEGHIRVRVPGHPHATTNGWALEHRVIANEMLGRLLLRSEAVHHINGIKHDNDCANLQVMTIAQHTRLHFGNPNNRQEGESNVLVNCACGCGETLLRYDLRGRSRRFIRGHNASIMA